MKKPCPPRRIPGRLQFKCLYKGNPLTFGLCIQFYDEIYEASRCRSFVWLLKTVFALEERRVYRKRKYKIVSWLQRSFVFLSLKQEAPLEPCSIAHNYFYKHEDPMELMVTSGSEAFIQLNTQSTLEVGSFDYSR